MRLAAPRFILDILSLFFRVGQCSRGNLSLKDTWQRRERWMIAHQMKCVDAVYSGSTRSSSGARALNGAIDGVNEHWTTLIKLRLWHIVGRHVDASGLTSTR